MKSQRGVSGVSSVFSLVVLACSVQANPVGEAVVGGAARFERSPGRLTINQGTDRLIVNWRGFSIGAGETTKFVQPSATSAALNRVLSGDPSRIYGNLEANGRVFLINPNGVLVGKGATINTHGFVASTLNVSDASFLSKAKLTLSGDSTAAVVNEGAIEAIGGDVFLIGRTVENSGSIRAANGTVGLAAGNEVVIVPTGRERVSVIAGNADGAPAGTGVKNIGTIEAVSAELKAAGGNIYALAINNGGIVRATGVRREGGRVFLTSDGGNIENSGTISAQNSDGSGGNVSLAGGHNAQNPAAVINSGTIEARGEAEGTLGGQVRLTGDYVGLFGSGLIDVSGHSGGGVALIGGDYQGANARIQNAQRTFVGPDAVIRADAVVRGDGGRIIVWADGATWFYGSISARGGASGGNGGFAEISGINSLVARGSLDLRAPLGRVGSVLYDPLDIEIVGGSGDGSDDPDASATGLQGGQVLFATEGAGSPVPFIVRESELESATANVILEARNSITVSGTFDNIAGGEGNDVVLLPNDLSLTMRTRNNTGDGIGGIDLTGGGTLNNLEFRSQGTGSILLQTGNDGGGGGGTEVGSAPISVGKLTTTGTGGITINGEGDVSIASALITGDVTATDDGGDDTARSGNITITSGGNVVISATAVVTTGDASLTGTHAGNDLDQAITGNISITAGSSGGVTIDGNVTTGNAAVPTDAGSQNDERATTGNIVVSAGTSVSGAGRLVTGNASLGDDAANGTDSVNSGNIAITAGTGGVSGGISLSAADALTTGNAVRTDGPDNGNDASTTDTANVGDITLISRDVIGSLLLPVNILHGTATAGTANNGVVSVNTATAGGDVFLGSSALLRVDTANVGTGDLTLTADEITFSGGADSVEGTGALVLRPATAGQDIDIAGAGGTAALDLTTTDLNALKDGFSGITIGRSADGSGAVTVSSAVSFGDDVTLVGGSIALNDTLTSSGNSVTLTARTGAITDGNAGAVNVVAANLSATAQTGIALDTTLTTLSLASVLGTGDIDVSDTDGLIVTSALTANGDITLAADGNLTVTAATAGAPAAGGDGDIHLTATGGGDVAVGLVRADADGVTISAAGNVTDGNGATENVVAGTLSVNSGGAIGIDLDTMIATLTAATATGTGDITINDLEGDLSVGAVTATGDTVTLSSVGAITDGNAGTVNVTASSLSATAQSGIDLDTDITTLTLASVLAAGVINISDASGLAVTDAQTFDGNITLAAAGNLAVTAVTAGTGVPANAGNGNIQLTTTAGGDVDLGVATAVADGVTINAAGAVTDANAGAVNVIADTLSATAQSGIDLDTTITTLTLASVIGTGDINISDSAGGLIVTAASTGTGGDVILAAAGGALDVGSATAGGSGDIQLTTTGGGNVNVGLLTASGDTVTINSSGAITDGNAGAVNVTAGNLSATAQSGINLDTDITTLTLASVLAAGTIDISDASGLAVTDAQTFDGNITLAAAGNLAVTAATAGTGVPANAGNGSIQLTTTAGGDVALGVATATADGVTINAAGAVTDANGGAVNVIADTLSATAQSGINLDTTITTLTLADVIGTGNINISDSAGGLIVTAASTGTGGDVILAAAGGVLDVVSATAGGSGDIQLSTTGGGNINAGVLTASGDTVTINSSGAVTDGNGAAVNVVAGDLSATAQTGIDLDTTITTLTLASVLGAGSIDIADTDDLVVTSALTDSGNIVLGAAGNLTVTAASAGTGVPAGVGNGNIQLTTTAAGDVAIGNIVADGDDVTVNSARDITDSQTDGAADVTATTMTLTAGRNIGTAVNPLGIGGSGGNVLLTASSGGVHVNAQSAGGADVNIVDSSGFGPSDILTRFTQGGRTYFAEYDNSANGNFTLQTAGNIAGAGISAPTATLTLRAGGSIGGGFVAPLSIDAGTFSGSAGSGLAVADSGDLTLGNISTTSGGFLVRAGDSLTLNAGTVLSAGAGNVILVADGAPGVTVSATPTINSRYLLYAVNASLTAPPVIKNQLGQPAIGGLVADVLDSPRNFNPADPDPFGDTSDYFVFRVEANPPTDPSLFIDIPMELYRPVSINFGEYDPTKFGEVGDLWMSSSELYEMERKAKKAPKPLPEKVDKSKYVTDSK